jgi:hypothetical protein
VRFASAWRLLPFGPSFGRPRSNDVWRFVVSDTMDETIHKDRIRAVMGSE